MKRELTVPIVQLPHAAGLRLPAYETEQSAGLDLLAAIGADEILEPGNRGLIPTGLAMSLPPGFEAQIRPRSGLAAKHGVTVLNSPGTIDADYRGEIGVILINHGDTPFTVTRGMRIAQMIIAPVSKLSWQLVPDLDQTDRGSGGFGSTGLASNKITRRG